MRKTGRLKQRRRRGQLDTALLAAIYASLIVALPPTAGAADLPNCVSAASDSDGDGWGWENEQSCIVVQSSQPNTDTPVDTSPTTPQFSNDGKPLCQSADSDPDGDGYGWEFNRSCAVPNSSAATVPAHDGNPVCSSASADEDGDGWGWENNQSCIVDSQGSGGGSSGGSSGSGGNDNESGGGGAGDQNTADSGGSGADTGGGSGDNGSYSAADITDLILIAGQSNTLGSGTGIDLSQDGSHPRVFAYTSDGWRIAALYQSWDQGSHPGNGNPNSSTSQYHNNFALHFGKRLAERAPNSIVGIILTSQPGEGIQHWDRGNTGYRLVEQKVTSAINELPHKSSIDGLLWHQGETDWLLNGTSDPDVPQPAPSNYYPARLQTLIGNFRSEAWYGYNKPFICGETIRADGVNTHLRALNSDSDPYTACVAGAGLPSRSPGGAHFNAEALRTIGRRYADEYYSLTN